MVPVIARLLVTAVASVASYFGFEVVADDAAVQAAVAVATAALSLWATLGLRRKDPASPKPIAKRPVGMIVFVLLALAGCGLGETPAADTLDALDQVCAVRDQYREETNAAATGADRLHSDGADPEVPQAPPEPPAGVAGEPAEAPPAPDAASGPAQ